MGRWDRCMHVIQWYRYLWVWLHCVCLSLWGLTPVLNQSTFHSPQTQPTQRRILLFQLSASDMLYDDLGEYFTDPCKRNCFVEIWVESTLNRKVVHWDLCYSAYQHPCDLKGKSFWMTTKRATKNAPPRKVYTNNPSHNFYPEWSSICRQHIFLTIHFF